MLRPYRKPLIVPLSKRLLKAKEASSDIDELVNGSFKTVIGEADASIDAKKVKRVVVCAGQVYYDLVNARREREVSDIAILRLEQLYPFPTDTFREELAKFPAAKEVMWVQEEPRNQGAWLQIRHRLEAGLGAKQTLAYAGRVSSASPAVGYMSKHVAQLKAFLEEAMTLKK
jgi:2-oxoglutarate dehydrogenase E1 component